MRCLFYIHIKFSIVNFSFLVGGVRCSRNRQCPYAHDLLFFNQARLSSNRLRAFFVVVTVLMTCCRD